MAGVRATVRALEALRWSPSSVQKEREVHEDPESDIDRLAHKRAAARIGWVVHAVVYLLVNLGLFAIALPGGRNWAVDPLLGWGMGLAIHGAVVLMALPGAGLYQRLLQRERSRLQALRDPW